MPKAKKLPSGNWRCQVYVGKVNGKNKYKSVTASTKKEAEYLASQLSYKYKESNDIANITLYDAIGKYVDSKSNILSPATIRTYLSKREVHFSMLMNMKIADIGNQELQAAINTDAAKYNRKTIKTALAIVKVVIKSYMPDRHFNVSLPSEKKTERVTLSIPQIQILLKAIKGNEYELPILLALWLGLRSSEVCGLKWHDYNPDIKTLYVHSALVIDKDNNLILKSTKTRGSTRTLSLPDYICSLLDKLEHYSEDDFIIKEHSNKILCNLKKICRQNGLPQIRFHDLRHSNASIMLMLGIPSKYAMERGGWTSTDVMEKIYQHTFSDEKKAVDNRINDYFDSLLFDKNE